MGEKIKTFKDLNAWKKGHELVILIYKITSKFPSRETYSLTDQLRRSSVSITSNIAEGFSRRGEKEKIRFYLMALGSLTELQNQLLVARDVGYVQSELFLEIEEQSILVHKLINGLIKGVKSHYS